MKKKVFAFVFAVLASALLCVGFAACNSSTESNDKVSSGGSESSNYKPYPPQPAVPSTPTHTHSYVEFVVQPTCTESGYTLHKCSCGEVYRDEEVASLGHMLDDWETIIEPTEKETGTAERRCVRNGCRYAEQKDLPALPSTTIKVTSVVLRNKEISLEVGETAALSVTVLPFNATNQKIHFKSVDPSMVSVSADGILTGVSDGEIEVYVISDENSSIMDSCKIKVTNPFAFDIFDAYSYELVAYNGKKKDVDIPENYKGKPVVKIGQLAFEGKNFIEHITIPDTVKYIGKYAFYECKSLKEIIVPDSVQGIGSAIFYGCASLKKMTIPFIGPTKTYDTWTMDYVLGWIFGGKIVKKGSDGPIGSTYTGDYNNYSYYHFIPDSLEEVALSDAATVLPYMSFSNCKNLKKIIIGNNVSEIRGGFNGCAGLESITLGENISLITSGSFSTSGNIWGDCVNLAQVVWNCKSVQDVNILGALFSRCRVSGLIIGKDVERIPVYAFENCSGLTSVTIPDSVISIGNSAFEGCSGLTSITIGNSVTTIGNSAFSRCSGLTNITIPNSVTSIYGSAFEDCSGLASVMIGNSVTSISGSAFEGCSGLKSVYITDLEKWCKISFGSKYSNPLYYAHRLYINNKLIANLVIPNSVTTIGDYTFENCSGLTSVTIPNRVTSIGEGAFSCCGELTSVTLPNNLTTIDKYAFWGCSGLTSITIPDSVTSIGRSAFEYCSSLTSIMIPDNVTTIGVYAFEYCSSLTNVTIGKSVTFIGGDAFSDCKMLTSVVFRKTNYWKYYWNGWHVVDTADLSNSASAAKFLKSGSWIQLRREYPY